MLVLYSRLKEKMVYASQFLETLIDLPVISVAEIGLVLVPDS